MTRGSQNIDSDFQILMILLSAIFCVVMLLLRRRRQPREKRITLTRAGIIRLAWGRGVLFAGAALPVLCLLLLAAYIGGGLSAGGALGSICVLALLFGLGMLAYARQVGRFLAHIQREARLPEGMELVRQDGFWRYVDEDWFIFIGRGRCAVLHAPSIDFSIPVQTDRESRLRGDEICEVLWFCQRSGGSICAMHPREKGIEKWIKSHGGRIDDAPP